MRKIGLIAAVLLTAHVSNALGQVDSAWSVKDEALSGFGLSVAVNNSGQIVVANAEGFPDSSCLAILKYDRSGVLHHVSRERLDTNGQDVSIRALSDLTQDIVYATGYVHGNGEWPQAFLARFGSSGSLDWFTLAPRHGEWKTEAFGLSSMLDGDIVIAGTDFSWTGNRSCFVTRYGPNGVPKWSSNYRGSAIYADPHRIVTDENGDVYVLATFIMPGSTSIFGVIKFSSEGEFLWMRSYAEPGPYGNASGVNLRISSHGDILVGGVGVPDLFGSDEVACVLQKYTSSGDLLWTTRITDPIIRQIFLTGFEVDGIGNIIATCSAELLSDSNIDDRDMMLFSLASDGSLRWTVRYSETALSLEDLKSQRVDDLGNTYLIVRISNVEPTHLNMLKVDSNGLISWVSRIGLSPALASGITFDLDGDSAMYVCGRTRDDFDTSWATVSKYTARWETSVDAIPRACPNIINAEVADLDYHSIRPGAAAANRPSVPVAVLGTKAFDVSRVDPSTIEIAGLSPLSHRVSDVSRPLEAREGECECTSAGADGYTDLVLYFDQAQFVAALGPVNDGEVRTLALTGKTKTGVPLSGSDCVTIEEGPTRISPLASAGEKAEAGFAAYPNPFNAATVVSFSLATDSDVRLDVYDVLGRRVATLVDDMMPAGEHQVSWDAAGKASGMYFARLATSAGLLTRKMVLVR